MIRYRMVIVVRKRVTLPAPVVTRIKVLDQLLYILERARNTLIARYGITVVKPQELLTEAYVEIEESGLPHATKYRYKLFLKRLAGLFGWEIARRKEAYRKSMKKYEVAVKRMRATELNRPSFSIKPQESENYESVEAYTTPDENKSYQGDYENLMSYYDWEE